MDPIRLEKFQAMKRYRRRRERTLLKRLLQNSVVLLLLASFLSSPLWLSYISSLLKSFFHFSPGEITAIFGTKFLFLTGNFIVIFLILDSKSSRCFWSAGDHIYDEYMINKHSNLQVQSFKGGQKAASSVKKIDQEEEEERESGYEDMDDGEEEEEEEEEEAEKMSELAKRSDDLIARVNQQWRLEAKMLPSYEKTVRRVQKLEEWIEAN